MRYHAGALAGVVLLATAMVLSSGGCWLASKPEITPPQVKSPAGAGEPVEEDFAAQESPARAALEKNGAKITLGKTGRVTEVELGPNGGDADLAWLKELPKVFKLKANRRGVTDEGMKALQGHPGIKILDLELSNVTDAGAAHLAELPKLFDINLKRSDLTAAGFSHLAKVKSLKRIRAPQTKFNDDCLHAIQGMEQLELLDLSDCNKVTEKGLEVLRGFPHLKGIYLWGQTITDNVLEYLQSAKELELLSLNQSKVSAAGLEQLKQLTSLNELHLYGAENVDNDTLPKLAIFSKLAVLDLRSTGVTRQGLKHLAALTELTSLDLSETSVGKKGGAFGDLQALSKLEDLNLWHTSADDAGLAAIGQFKQLRRLNLDDCKVTDAGLVHLKGLVNLTYLHLGKNDISDAGLENLLEMKQLKELDINSCGRITDEAVKKLPEKLPELKKIKR